MGRREFLCITNEKETKYFNVDKDYLPKELVEVIAIPNVEEALVDKKSKRYLEKPKRLLAMTLLKCFVLVII